MSSTHKKKAERGLDFFATPAWVVKAILPHLTFPYRRTKLREPLRPISICDPCAGQGAILAALQDAKNGAVIQTFGFEISQELVQDSFMVADHVTQRDALTPAPWRTRDGHDADLIVMNPPFVSAFEFVERALSEVGAHGEVAVLLRLAFLASEKRRVFHQKRPSDLFILPKRPSFCVVVRCKAKCGWEVMLSPEARLPRLCVSCHGPVVVTRTDSADYAWFLYGPGRGGRWSILETPNAT